MKELDYEKLHVRRDRVLVEVLDPDELNVLKGETLFWVEQKATKDLIVARVKAFGPEALDVEKDKIVLLPSKAMNRPDARLILVKEADILAIEEDE